MLRLEVDGPSTGYPPINLDMILEAVLEADFPLDALVIADQDAAWVELEESKGVRYPMGGSQL